MAFNYIVAVNNNFTAGTSLVSYSFVLILCDHNFVGDTCVRVFPTSVTKHLRLYFFLMTTLFACSTYLIVVSGTSASSPVLAGMVALVNAARIADGKSALG